MNNKLEELHQRITELENKITFQDNYIEQLNNALIEQQQIIFKLQRQYQIISNKFSELSTSNLADFNQQEKPPHY